MVNELNGHATPCLFTIQNLIKITIFKMMVLVTVLWSVTLTTGSLTKLGLFFPVLCFIHVFDQTLAEQLYPDKGLLVLVWELVA